ncbi:SDR family NAD(P)-dependent oxidoreductase [Kitasatospora purpeofusca]|uniref:SDR family NAD(P)-dependent oxidoreductase n=1 Tax=Kitasatospora purpeofusca TaxID=67352 RepID=A0ABZ1UDP9_9ACTN|nr:SDR family NAD(P)-dependent oxidoreductase [Kitasatospora purpeofusca]
MTRRWLVTGCSTGLGRALAGAAAEAGDRVLATARRVETLDGLVRDHPGRVLALPLDVRDPEQCEQAVATMLKRFGGVDVLVNNAGNGVFGTVEEVGDHELRDQLETLVVGPRGPSSNPRRPPEGRAVRRWGACIARRRREPLRWGHLPAEGWGPLATDDNAARRVPRRRTAGGGLKTDPNASRGWCCR